MINSSLIPGAFQEMFCDEPRETKLENPFFSPCRRSSCEWLKRAHQQLTPPLSGGASCGELSEGGGGVSAGSFQINWMN